MGIFEFNVFTNENSPKGGSGGSPPRKILHFSTAVVALLTEKVGDVRPLYLEKVGDFRKKCANRAIARPKNITDNVIKYYSYVACIASDGANCNDLRIHFHFLQDLGVPCQMMPYPFFCRRLAAIFLLYIF